jgi:hypothetical protein
LPARTAFCAVDGRQAGRAIGFEDSFSWLGTANVEKDANDDYFDSLINT